MLNFREKKDGVATYLAAAGIDRQEAYTSAFGFGHTKRKGLKIRTNIYGVEGDEIGAFVSFVEDTWIFSGCLYPGDGAMELTTRSEMLRRCFGGNGFDLT